MHFHRDFFLKNDTGVPASGRAFALPLVAVEPPLASRPYGLQSLTHFAPTLRMAAGSRCAPLGRHPSGKCSGFDWGFGAETMAAPSSPLTPGKPCYPHPNKERDDNHVLQARIFYRRIRRPFLLAHTPIPIRAASGTSSAV